MFTGPTRNRTTYSVIIQSMSDQKGGGSDPSHDTHSVM